MSHSVPSRWLSTACVTLASPSSRRCRAVNEHEAPDPGDVRLPRPAAVVPGAERSAHLVQKP